MRPWTTLRWLALAGMLGWTTRDAQAGVEFYVDDPGGFLAATSPERTLLGSEDWSSGTGGSQLVTDPLSPGVAKGPFPNGVNAATGMTVQSNTLGSAGTTPSPGGDLFFAPAGTVGVSGNAQPSAQLSGNTNGYGFDLIFGGAGVQRPTAVSLTPTFYRTTGSANAGPIAVRVFDEQGGELGTTTVPDVVDALQGSFLGIVATNLDTIGRINLWPGASAVAGADDIDVFALPEADATPAALVALFGLAIARRR